MPSRSAAVYSGLTSMPSGVCQTSVSGSAPFSSLAASSRHRARSSAIGRERTERSPRRSEPAEPATTVSARHATLGRRRGRTRGRRASPCGVGPDRRHRPARRRRGRRRAPGAAGGATATQPTFFLGQSYGGTLESLVAAVPVRVFGGETMALRSAAGAISLVSVALLFFLARRAARRDSGRHRWRRRCCSPGRRCTCGSASDAGLLRVVARPRPRPVPLLAVLADDQRWRWYAVLGLVAGVAWWQSPYVVYFAVPGWRGSPPRHGGVRSSGCRRRSRPRSSAPRRGCSPTSATASRRSTAPCTAGTPARTSARSATCSTPGCPSPSGSSCRSRRTGPKG